MKTLEDTKQVINDLYKDIDGYKFYKQAKEKHGSKHDDLVYGEIPVEVLDDMLKELGCSEGIFYDLGSGTGKLVIAAQMLCGFTKCIGIEILDELHKIAVEKGIEYTKTLKDNERKCIEFIHSDFLGQNFNDADLVLISLPSQNPETMEKLEKKIEDLRSGTKIITVIGFIKSDSVKEIKSKKYNFPWGKSTAYFYEKK